MTAVGRSAVGSRSAAEATAHSRLSTAAITRSRVIEEARRFIGTPYRHQASLAGAGCDCLGLVRGVWRALYGPEPEPMPPYTPDWGEAALPNSGVPEFGNPNMAQLGNSRLGREVLLEIGHRHLVPVPLGGARPGDVLVFRMREGRIAKHCGILAERIVNSEIASRAGESIRYSPFATRSFTMIHAQSRDRVREVALSAPWRKRLAAVFAFPGVVD